jgi:hypothetical protein
MERILMHHRTITCTGILHSIFQGKKCVLQYGKYGTSAKVASFFGLVAAAVINTLCPKGKTVQSLVVTIDREYQTTRQLMTHSIQSLI